MIKVTTKDDKVYTAENTKETKLGFIFDINDNLIIIRYKDVKDIEYIYSEDKTDEKSVYC
jgi:hypothetical protein